MAAAESCLPDPLTFLETSLCVAERKAPQHEGHGDRKSAAHFFEVRARGERQNVEVPRKFRSQSRADGYREHSLH